MLLGDPTPFVLDALTRAFMPDGERGNYEQMRRRYNALVDDYNRLLDNRNEWIHYADKLKEVIADKNRVIEGKNRVIKGKNEVIEEFDAACEGLEAERDEYRENLIRLGRQADLLRKEAEQAVGPGGSLAGALASAQVRCAEHLARHFGYPGLDPMLADRGRAFDGHTLLHYNTAILGIATIQYGWSFGLRARLARGEAGEGGLEAFFRFLAPQPPADGQYDNWMRMAVRVARDVLTPYLVEPALAGRGPLALVRDDGPFSPETTGRMPCFVPRHDLFREPIAWPDAEARGRAAREALEAGLPRLPEGAAAVAGLLRDALEVLALERDGGQANPHPLLLPLPAKKAA